MVFVTYWLFEPEVVSFIWRRWRYVIVLPWCCQIGFCKLTNGETPCHVQFVVPIFRVHLDKSSSPAKLRGRGGQQAARTTSTKSTRHHCPLGVTPSEFRRDLWRPKTRVPGLSYGVVCVILRLVILVQCRLVTDWRTDTRQQHIPL